MSGSDELVYRQWLATRDADAFTELVSSHAAMVYATCRRILNNPTDAEDVAQECFVELIKSPGSEKKSIGGWLHTVAIRRSLDYIKN